MTSDRIALLASGPAGTRRGGRRQRRGGLRGPGLARFGQLHGPGLAFLGVHLEEAGAIEAAATILAIKNEVLPPTANFNVPDPECDLDVIPNESRPQAVEAALSNSFAFGGLNAVLAFRRFDA